MLNVTIVGFGNIGRCITSLLLSTSKEALHINIMDVSTKLTGSLLDFQHALQLYPQHSMSYNDQHKMNESNFVFHCAGASVPKGKSRLDTCEQSMQITENVFTNYKPSLLPFIIIVSNPVDVISHITQKITNLPVERIIGTGTLLDSLRMNFTLKHHFPNAKNINSVLLGEHGKSVFVSQHLSKVDSISLEDIIEKEQLNECLTEVKNSAQEIKDTQGATIYGVSHAACEIYNALQKEEKTQLPVSTKVPQEWVNEHNLNTIYLSCPCELSQEGVQLIADYKPTSSELIQYLNTVRMLGEYIPEKYS